MKHLKLLFLFSTIALFMAGCRMNCCDPNDIEYTTFAKSNAPIEALIKNPKDLEDEKMNTYLYTLSSAIKELARDKDFKRLVIKEADRTDGKSLNLMEFAKEFPDYEKKINDYFATNNKSSDDGPVLSLNTIADSMTYNGISYYPTLYVINAVGANEDFPAVVAIGAGVTSPNATSAGEDYAAGWYLDTTGVDEPVILDEHIANNTLHPIIILSTGSTFTGTLSTDSVSVEIDTMQGSGKTDIIGDPYINEYKILYQYDDNDSEYKYCYAQTTAYNVTSCCWGGNICSMDVSDLATTFTGKHIDVLAAPLNLWGLNIVTYENDWYVSNKTLCWYSPMSSAPQHIVCVDYRAKYQHEWYQYGDIDFYTQPSMITIYSKGKIKFSWN